MKRFSRTKRYNDNRELANRWDYSPERYLGPARHIVSVQRVKRGIDLLVICDKQNLSIIKEITNPDLKEFKFEMGKLCPPLKAMCKA